MTLPQLLHSPAFVIVIKLDDTAVIGYIYRDDGAASSLKGRTPHTHATACKQSLSDADLQGSETVSFQSYL